MDQAIEFMKGFNIQTILSLVVIVWAFSSSLKNRDETFRSKDRSTICSDRQIV